MKKVCSLITKRHSCRDYIKREIANEDIMTLLESARWAPSGKNGQPWRFVIIKNEEIIDRIASYSIYKEWMKSANAYIVVFLDRRVSYNYVKDVQAIGAAIENICLQATDMGIGSCWIGEILDNKDYVEQILDVPLDYELMAVICLGYAQKECTRTKRVALEKLIFKVYE